MSLCSLKTLPVRVARKVLPRSGARPSCQEVGTNDQHIMLESDGLIGVLVVENTMVVGASQSEKDT